MKLMLFDEGLSSFRKSMEMRPIRRHVMSYVEALGITKPKEKYDEEIVRLRKFLSELSEETDFDGNVIDEAEEILRVARSGIEVDIPADIYTYVQDLADEYHAATGV